MKLRLIPLTVCAAFLLASAAATPADSTKKADLSKVKGKRVAILVTDGFEQVEMTGPRKALDEAGARTTLIAPKAGRVKGWAKTDWGKEFDVDLPLDKARAADFDALLLPGGVMSPDKLRLDERAVAFVKAFFDDGRPVAAICHGPWTLIDAGVVKGRRMTSWPSLKRDLANAGATWVDEEVVADRGLVTSRKPDDIPAFNRKMLEGIAEGRQPRK
jgi:protease I